MVKMQGNACKSAIRALFSRTERFRPRYTLTYRLRGMLYLVIVRSSPKTSRPEPQLNWKASSSQDLKTQDHIYTSITYHFMNQSIDSLGLSLH